MRTARNKLHFRFQVSGWEGRTVADRMSEGLAPTGAGRYHKKRSTRTRPRNPTQLSPDSGVLRGNRRHWPGLEARKGGDDGPIDGSLRTALCELSGLCCDSERRPDGNRAGGERLVEDLGPTSEAGGHLVRRLQERKQAQVEACLELQGSVVRYGSESSDVRTLL